MHTYGCCPSHFMCRKDRDTLTAGHEAWCLLQVLYEEEVRRLTDTFEQQFHYGVFYSYMRLREQEIRNLMWISECVAQDQKSRIMDGIVFLF